MDPRLTIQNPGKMENPEARSTAKAILLTLAIAILHAAPCPAGSILPAAEFREARRQMVENQIRRRGIRTPRVLAAMEKVPRHLFVPAALRDQAYADHPLPIGEGQTISQPYIVALMTDSLNLTGSERVLEIGTGSGYQAAVLAELAREVFTIEIEEALYRRATERLSGLGYGNIRTRHGDGYAGWEAAAPFDCIMITAAVDHIPHPLIAQLRDGGHLILPLGDPAGYQNLALVTRAGEEIRIRQISGVRFVPMTGRARESENGTP
jgi:protein-L-isoaspartate(D-aspartate) O-methyltransferase